MHRSTKLLICFLTLILAAGCADQDKTQAEENRPYAAAAATAMAENTGDAPAESDDGSRGKRQAHKPLLARKLIQRVTLVLEVESFTKSQRFLEGQLKELGGFVANSDIQHHENADTATLVLRVPAARIDDLLTSAAGEGKVIAERRSAEDVTGQYVDTSARLATQKQLEKRLLEIAAAGTSKVSDLLEVERELARVRSQIESMEGQVKRWDTDVRLATVEITMRRNRPIAQATFGGRIKKTFNRSLGTFGSSAQGMVIVVAAMLPWLLPFGLLFVVLRRFQLRLRRKKAVAVQA